MPSCKTPGPLCQYSNSVDLDPGTLIRHRTPCSGSTGLSPRPSVPPAARVDTLILDQEHILNLLGSVASAKVLERHTKLVWKPYDESTVLNVIYSILPYEKPGTVEVQTGDSREAAVETEREAQHLLEQFVLALSGGPARSVRFLEAQEQIRHSCLNTVSGVYREAAGLNADVQAVAQRAVARLALIKAVSTIVLKGVALGVAGMPAFLIGTGYDLSLNLIRDWNQAPEAKLVGVETKLADKLAKKAVKDTAKNLAYAYKAEEHQHAQKAQWLDKRLAEMERQLETRANAERLRKFARDSRRLARAQEAAGSARFWSRALSSVRYVFFAWDVYAAAQDARTTLHDVGYSNSWEGIKDAGF